LASGSGSNFAPGLGGAKSPASLASFCLSSSFVSQDLLMLKKQTRLLAGAGLLGAAAVLLSGCGGGSFSKNTFNNYPNTLPYAYGIEPIAYYGQANAAGLQATIEGSGLQDAANGQAYITGASAFTVVTANGAALPSLADPNGTNVLPLGFSLKGLYVDAVNQTGAKVSTVTSVAPGASVLFHAALSNGTSSNNTAPAITGATLTSTDPALAGVAGLTAGLPMTLNVIGGAFSNATYATGTGGTATPFTIPAGTPTGIHTMTVTVSDAAGRVTATQFEFPVVAAADAAVLANIAPTVPEGSPAGTTVIVLSASATITAPTAGANAQTTVDTQNNVFLFAAPGEQTITATAQVEVDDSKGKMVATYTQTGTLAVPLTAGATVPDAVVTVAGTAAAAPALRRAAVRHH